LPSKVDKMGLADKDKLRKYFKITATLYLKLMIFKFSAEIEKAAFFCKVVLSFKLFYYLTNIRINSSIIQASHVLPNQQQIFG